MEKAAVRVLEWHSDDDFPIAIATMAATPRQRRVAAGVVGVLFVLAVLIAPFAHIQVGRVDAFIPVLQTVLSVADLVTATLIFVQYSIQPQPALLALGSGYIFSGSFAFLQTLSFPGGYAPVGLIGDGYNSPAWFFVLWHVTFPLAILIYALSKNAEGRNLPRASIKADISVAILCALATVGALTLMVTTGVGNLPSFYTGNVTLQTRLGNQVNIALLVWYATALLVLFARRRTVLDLWLMVTLLAWTPNFLVAAFASSVRFSLGWYAARGFALVASCMLLCVLLTEMTVLYSRLANAFSLLRRERDNRLMSIDAATAAIAHEVRTPLAAIALNANTALAHIRANPPELSDLEGVLADIEADSFRADKIIAVVRGLFKNAADQRTVADLDDIVRQVLNLAQPDLQAGQVSVVTEFRDDVTRVHVDPTQLQRVILNLVRNAIDAMESLAPRARRLHLTTRLAESSTVVLSVEDSGPGISVEHRDRIFDAFFTTKPSGMGLGLAISRTIVESHAGNLTYAGSGAHGAIFEIALPAVTQPHG